LWRPITVAAVPRRPLPPVVLSLATLDFSAWTLPAVLNGGRVSGPLQQLTRLGTSTVRPALSSDGRKLVFLSDRSGKGEIWLRDMESGKETALTATPGTPPTL